MQMEGPKNAHANSDTQAAEINSYDAVVIGSGYGGSVAALRLAEAGLKVCLLEKGRQWEAHQFPTSAWQTLRTTRWHTPLGVFGSSDSLYQIHYQGAVIAFVAAGLGGGSLINGGVVLPTPARAKRDPRWPLEWSGAAWDTAQSRARSMLQAESVPTQCSFYQDRVLKAVANEIEDSVPDRVELSIKLSRDSNGESSSSNDACKACGNCFTGCPYNAKKSVDESYIGAAVKAGCTILTQCEARFVLPNFNHTFTSEEREEHSWQRHRRWRIYLDEINFITADFVVMAAGVLGTTNLLLQSKIRGLPLSDKIGHGFSCNGNSVAFVCGTHVTTKGHSLISSQLKDTPAFDRPGPSITTSYTSSLGYTIQGAILANGFSFVFFKCISHRGFWFGLIYGLWHKIKRLMKTRNSDSLIFNMMGHDAADGRVEFDLDRGLAKFFPPTDPLITKKISTVERMVKRIGGQMFMPTLRNTTVHLLGGCSVGPSYKDSVANPNGQVFCTCGYFHSKCSSSASANKQERDDDSETCETHIHNGLYVCDASLIPCAVGVNPSFTITTVAEHVAQAIVKDAASYYTEKGESVLVDEHASTVMSPSDFLYGNTILNGNSMRESFNKSGARVWETLVGNIEGLPCTLEIVMDMGSSDISQDILRGRVGGKLRMQALESGLLHIVDGTVDMCVSSTRSPFSQYMLYRLLLVAETGSM